MHYREALGKEPSEIARPATIDEAAEIVRVAAASGKSIIPWGGGTGQRYGYVPARADVLLDLTGLQRVIAHEFADLTITVEAGATLSRVQDALALHNQYVPLDPPHPETATVGGILATNAFGPGVVGAGSARDWLIGLAVIDAQGRLIRGGGKVVKNVTGYDLPKIHIGALGTLGIIVEATFKVAPRPEATRLGVFTCVNPQFGLRLHSETAPSMSLLRSTSLGAVLAVLYNGLPNVAESELSRAAAIASECGEVGLSALPSGMLPPFSETLPESPLILRFAGGRAASVERHNQIADLAEWNMIDTFLGSGHTDAFLNMGADPVKAWRVCREWAVQHGISVTIWDAPVEMRQQDAILWQPVPVGLPLMRRLKEALDPTHTLNPGRFLGGI